MLIYVVTHKKFNYNLPKNYEFIQVNGKNNDHFTSLTDDMFIDNISIKNPFYCELTASYLIWKNDKENDIVGLMHYRRYLTKNRFSESSRHYLNEKDIKKDLAKYDFISTKLSITEKTVKDDLLKSVREKDYNLLEKTIGTYYPDYLDDFKNVMNGNKSYLLNLFISKKSLFDEYYSWLFDILFKMEKEVDMTGYSTQEMRLYGFLAERLFYVYVMHNNLKVKSYPVNIVGESKIRIIRQKIIKMVKILFRRK
jgi:hypothetical protein